MTGQDEDLGGRLPLLQPDELTTEQRRLYDYLQSSKVPWADRAEFRSRLPDGRMIGPFNGFLFSPDIAQGFNDWVDAETEHSSLSPTVRQVIILTVGQIWNSPYEVYAHVRVARTTDLPDQAIDYLVDGREPVGTSVEEITAHRFVRALVVDHAVNDDLYGQAVEVFGNRGIVDLVHLTGQYLATCALLNAFEIPRPDA